MKMRNTIVGLLIIFLMKPALVFSSGTITEYSRELPPNYRYNNMVMGNQPGSLFGPRIAWAEPYALGKLKLLIILPIDASHEAVELRSRIPADISLITPTKYDQWFDGKEGDNWISPSKDILNNTANRLLGLGYHYDAIIIGKVRWSIIPLEIRNKVLEKVKGGTALVWISPWDVEDDLRKQMGLSEPDNSLAKKIRSTVPLGILPLDFTYKKTLPNSIAARRVGPLEIRIGKLGSGNVVCLDYQDRLGEQQHQKDFRTVHEMEPWRSYSDAISLSPFVADDELYYDYYFSILGKALYHASGKTTTAAVHAQEPLVTVERQKLPSSPLSFSIELSEQELRDWSVVYEVRDRHNRVINKGAVGNLDFIGHTARFSLPLPQLSQGTYVVDVWALQRGAVLDWASAALIVTDTKYLDSIQPEKEYFAHNDRIGGTVKFATPLTKDLSVIVELWDSYSRLVAIAELEDGNGKFEFPPIANPLSRIYHLVACVKENGFVIDQADVWVGLPNNTLDDYQVFVWANAVNTRINRKLMHQYKQNAVSGYYDLITWLPRELIFESADALARNNLLALPYCYGSWNFCISPKSTLENQLKSRKMEVYPPRVEAYRRYGTIAYSTSEESYISRDEKAWDNPDALNDYHLYLKDRYGDIMNLNQVWGTKFNNFDDISLISFMTAKTSHQATRWMEQELHKIDRFNMVEEITFQTIQNMDPGARVSLDCQGGMDFDWPRMAKIIRAGSQTPLAPFRADVNFYTTWTGYYPCFGANWIGEYMMRIPPWQKLFQGGRHILWWPGTMFSADLCEPLQCTRQAIEEYRELENGIGKLLISSHKKVDPILLFWSNSSYYAGIMYPGELTWEMAREHFEYLFQRIGFDYQAVGAEFIEESLEYSEQQRVLLLPACQAISRKGVKKIRTFAEAGGLVIADYPPATLDEYLRPYGATSTSECTFETCPKCQGKKRVEINMVWQACPVCGGTGQIIKGENAPNQSLLEDVFDFSRQSIRKIGKGYGLFLKGSPVRREEWGAIRKSLIENASIQSDIEVQDTLGNLRTDVQSYVFDNGRAIFLGIIPDRTLNNPPGEKLTVKLKSQMHVYDVRRQQYLGKTDLLKSAILLNEAKLLAFLPERIEGLNISLSKKSGRPGDVMEISGELLPKSLKDSKMVVRIEITKNGKIQEAYTKNLSFNGSFTYPIPLALNQMSGNYHVKISEIISGYTQEIVYVVE